MSLPLFTRFEGPLAFPAVVDSDPAVTAGGEWYYVSRVPPGTETGDFRATVRVLVPRNGFYVNSSIPTFAPKHKNNPSLVVKTTGKNALHLYDADPRHFDEETRNKAYLARRAVIAQFHTDALAAVVALQKQEMLANFWARIQKELADKSPADIRDALKRIGKFDEVAREEKGVRYEPTDKERLSALMSDDTIDAVTSALKPVADELESKGMNVERLGPYKDGERKALTEHMVMSSCDHFSKMHTGKVASSQPGGLRDNTIDALLRHWKRWRPVVAERLGDIQQAVREALGGHETTDEILARFSLQSPEALMSDAPTIDGFLRGSAVPLLLRSLVHWQLKEGGEKAVTNDHLQAIFTCGSDQDQSSGLMAAALKEATRKKEMERFARLKDHNDFNTLLFDRLQKRASKKMSTAPARLPHALNLMWYWGWLERRFKELWKKDCDRQKGVPMSDVVMSPVTAETLRIAAICMLSGGYISQARSTEASTMQLTEFKEEYEGGPLVSTDEGKFVGCRHKTCRCRESCYGNRLVLKGEHESVLIQCHWKTGAHAKTAQSVLLPEELAQLLRLWILKGRAVVMMGPQKKYKPDHGMLFCSSTGCRLKTRATLLQAKKILDKLGVNTRSWCDLANVRQIRHVFLEVGTGPESLAQYVDKAVRMEQEDRKMEVTGLQALVSNEAQHAFWHAATIGAKTSKRQAENNYTTDTSVHAKMAEMLWLVRKWILKPFKDMGEAPLGTSTNIVIGQMFELAASASDSGSGSGEGDTDSASDSDCPCGTGSASGTACLSGSASGSHGIGDSDIADEGPLKRARHT